VADLVYQSIRATGTQQGVLDQMQSRDDLYSVLDYHAYENQIDEILKKANQA
jgi:methylisocitrate lyase